jgi:hypothetical protein
MDRSCSSENHIETPQVGHVHLAGCQVFHVLVFPQDCKLSADDRGPPGQQGTKSACVIDKEAAKLAEMASLYELPEKHDVDVVSVRQAGSSAVPQTMFDGVII